MGRTRAISILEVVQATSLSRSTIERMLRDGHFPKPIRLSVNRRGWLESDVEQWLKERGSASSGEDQATG